MVENQKGDMIWSPQMNAAEAFAGDNLDDDDDRNDEDQEDSEDDDESVNIDPGILNCNENVNNM